MLGKSSKLVCARTFIESALTRTRAHHLVIVDGDEAGELVKSYSC